MSFYLIVGVVQGDVGATLALEAIYILVGGKRTPDHSLMAKENVYCPDARVGSRFCCRLISNESRLFVKRHIRGGVTSICRVCCVV